jgi:hypothetical protein
MKLEINVPVSGLDLASLLDGEQGLFLCQNRGQNYITIAKAGHSIAFGPTPIGKAIVEQVTASVGPEPWFVTKISNSTELAEFRGDNSRARDALKRKVHRSRASVGQPAEAFVFRKEGRVGQPFIPKKVTGGKPSLLAYFFQPLPFPSGVSAGAYSGVRSTSSVRPSNSGSIRDFPWCSFAMSM